MPKLDLTISISVILAVCAIISPIATAIINNKHQINLKKLEYAHKAAETSLFYKRGIYEDYLRCVGKCFSFRTQEALQEYGKTYALALIYFPSSLVPDVKNLNNYLLSGHQEEAISLFNELAPQIRDILETLFLPNIRIKHISHTMYSLDGAFSLSDNLLCRLHTATIESPTNLSFYRLLLSV